jgi:MFS family permease
MPSPPTRAATIAVTCVPAFMVGLDNLVVVTALATIRDDLQASVEQLSWTVNAYVLSVGVLMLTGAVLGDRLGRRRMFVVGLLVFSAASASAALAPSAGWLIAARAVQGAGAALIMPLSLTLLSAAVPPNRRGAAIGAWSAIIGTAVAIGPLVGGAIIEGFSWQAIFWINVPIGLLAAILSVRTLPESFGVSRPLDLPGLALASTALLGIVFASFAATRPAGRTSRPSSRVSWACPCSSPSHGGSAAPPIRCSPRRWSAGLGSSPPTPRRS